MLIPSFSNKIYYLDGDSSPTMDDETETLTNMTKLVENNQRKGFKRKY